MTPPEDEMSLKGRAANYAAPGHGIPGASVPVLQTEERPRTKCCNRLRPPA